MSTQTLCALDCVRVWFFAAGLALCAMVNGYAESSKPVLVIDIQGSLGGGADISADGRNLVYVSKDGLHVRNLNSGDDRPLASRVGQESDVFVNPKFSPDGKRILVSASGGTWYYPSDIYSISVVDDQIVKLTKSREMPRQSTGNAVYSQYFYSAIQSPVSNAMLLSVYDAVRDVLEVGLIQNGTFLSVGSGTPLVWDDDGKAFWFIGDHVVKRYEIATQKTSQMPVPGTVKGGDPDKGTFFVDNGTEITIANFGKIGAHATSSLQALIPRTVLQPARNRGDLLVLEHASVTKTGRVLLRYAGRDMQHLIVLDAPAK